VWEEAGGERGGAEGGLKWSEPSVAVLDVVATTRFYREMLGFQGEWVWGEPPTFGGGRWGEVQVMFCQQPGLAGRVEGHQHAFSCEDIDSLRERHRSSGAPVISEIANKPWGVREYTVGDLHGYDLRFGGPAAYERTAGGAR